MKKLLIVLVPLLLNVFAFMYSPKSKDLIQDNIYPIKNANISSGFGHRKGNFHWGIDFSAPYGTPVIAPVNLKIYKTGWSENHGLFIIAKDDDNFYYTFAHLSKTETKETKVFRQGDIIGYVGSSGLSFGPHLHYEILFNGVYFNPTNFSKKNFKVNNLEDDFFDSEVFNLLKI